MPRALILKTFCALFAATQMATATEWTFDSNVRARWESREQTYTFNRSVPSPTDDSWWLTRLQLGAKGEFSPGWLAYVQLQDSREHGTARSSVPFISGSEGDDPVDFRQVYFEHKAASTTWRVGRQALVLGDERLVGISNWNNFSRTFDAVRVTFPKIGEGADVFVSSVVQIQPGSKTGWHANHSSTHDLFGGVYTRFAPAPKLKLEPYLLGRNSRKDLIYSAGPAGSSRPYDIPQKVLTAGVRLVGGPAEKLHGFEYDAEFAGQAGQTRGRQLVGAVLAYPGPAWLSHRAWALHAGAGYSFSFGEIPLRLYAELNRASGDRDPTDRRDQSFNNLFPSNHRPYGLMDVFSWKNMREIAVTAVTTIAGTKARLEQHWFSLDNVNDTWFRSNGSTAVRPLTAGARVAPRRAGEETDFIVSRGFGKKVTVEVGFNYFAAGPYLARTGGANDGRLGYIQTLLKW